ncbi:MAG: GNAT family N-acetyltransferase [Candidimonas sp.]|nr:MAG: GNAT family N-acetyltransferase [Candidimonas sp.]
MGAVVIVQRQLSWPVAQTRRNQSCGRKLIREAEHLLVERGCLKINLLVCSSNTQVIGFYKRLRYNQDDALSLGRCLMPDKDA